MYHAAIPLLLVHSAATLLMTGIIWFVQVVHYPLFQKVPAASFPAYERDHQSRTGLLVGPLMLLELGTAVALVLTAWRQPRPFPESTAILLTVNAVLLLILWALTFFVQVPHHEALARQQDADRIQALVRGNWLRTLLWTARAILLLKIFSDRFPASGI